jgi:hypothetical protein
MVVTSCVDHHHLWRQGIEEESVAGIIITVMIGLDNIHIAADSCHPRFHISLV